MWFILAGLRAVEFIQDLSGSPSGCWIPSRSFGSFLCGEWSLGSFWFISGSLVVGFIRFRSGSLGSFAFVWFIPACLGVVAFIQVRVAHSCGTRGV